MPTPREKLTFNNFLNVDMSPEELPFFHIDSELSSMNNPQEFTSEAFDTSFAQRIVFFFFLM